MSIVRRQSADERDWAGVRFMVFDAPEVAGTASERLSHAAIALLDHPWAVVVPHRVCAGVDDLMDELDRVIALGGEGVMLKHPTNLYTAGRNGNHLKVKRFYDAEAVVIGHEPGKGKHTGRLGALLCMDTQGRQFGVGTGLKDAQRNTPPPIGARITYKYQERTQAGKPRFPVFMRVRPTE
jgi:DNA ligase-1